VRYAVEIPDEAPVRSFTPLTLRDPLEILAMEFDPADLLLENGYLAKGSSIVLAGQGGLGKSRLAMQLAISCILGTDFLGWKTKAQGTKWLFLQTENGNRRLKHDLQRMLAGRSEDELEMLRDGLRLHTLETEDDSMVGLGNEVNCERVCETLERFPADVVVFDPLRDFGAGDLNSDDTMALTCATISRVTKKGNPKRIPMVLHHAGTGKAGAAKAAGFDRSSFGRNSKVLHGWTRAQVNLAPINPDTNDVLLVTIGKANDFPECEPFAIRLDPETMTYSVAPEVDIAEWRASMGTATAKKAAVSIGIVADIVRKAGLEGISKAELTKAIMDETGCAKTCAYGLVEKAEKKLKTIQRRKTDALYVCA
jgi:hypothetical protein